ncbi:MAG: PQQ-binding-like beta-propeller repeat protein [Candidatus Bathyarchaeia archaeon]
MKLQKGKTLSGTAIIMTLILTATLTALPPANAVTTFTTNAFISLAPNPVGVGQTCHVRLFLSYFPPTANDYFHGFRYMITNPDGTSQSGGPFTSDPNGAYDFSFVPMAVGNYTFQFSYPGESFANNTITFTSSQTQATLGVQQNPVQPWPDAPLPRDYWTRPVSAEFRTWFAITGNWLQGGYDASGRFYGDSAGFNPYTQAPRAPHVVWVKDAALGGLIGGTFGSDNYYSGLQYDSKVSPPIVMNGRIYYRLFQSSSGAAGAYKGFACVDLRSGEEYWRNTTGNVDFGQIYVSRGYNGQGGRAFLYDSSATTWTVYDAWSGTPFWYLNSAIASPSKIFFGPNGDIYAYFVTGSTAARRLIMWNSTLAWQKYGWFSGDTLRSDRPGTYNWTLGIQWNVSVTNVGPWGYGSPSVLAADPSTNTIVLQATHTEAPNDGIVAQLGYDAMTGAELWAANRTFQGTLNTRLTVGSGILMMMNMGTLQRSGFDIRTGVQIWTSDPTEAPWGMYTSMGVTAYDKAYSGAYDGYLRAYDIKTGKQVWQYYIGNSGLETPYGTWPMFNGPTIGGYVVFCGYSEHTPNSPLYRGAKLAALDATTGNELWTINEWLSLRALADGYLVTVNMYDNRIFVLGKGPSATTVSAPLTAVPKGTPVMITGTVTDQSPGAKGTPAISDASMSEWMEYLYMQKPIPGNATGVPVILTATGPNGETVNIGEVRSDMGGSYGKMWTPPSEGTWNIMATFLGSDSYGSSYATTYLGVGPAPAAPQPATPTPPAPIPPTTPPPSTAAPTTAAPSPTQAPPPEQGPATEMYYIAAAAAVIIVIAAAAAIVLKRRK